MQPSTPGVYVEEIKEDLRASDIVGASTSTTVFIGKAVKGLPEPTRVFSFQDFQNIFGGLWEKSTLAYSLDHYFQNGGRTAVIVRQRAGDNYASLFSRLEKSQERFDLLCFPFSERESIDEDDFYNIIIPQGLALCERRGAIFIIDPPISWDTVENARKGWKRITKRNVGALYFPRIEFEDPLTNGRTKNFPPSGAVAGVIARTDTTRGVSKAPAGLDAHIYGATDLQINLTSGQQELLNPLGINCIRKFDNRCVIWGARTLNDDRSGNQWKYLNVRRLAFFIEKSIHDGMQWAVFEPNDESLWSQIRLKVGAFMHELFRKGAFQGSTPKEAYFVKCDRETTSKNDIDGGMVNILVGFAPLKPAEFIILRIKQQAKKTT